MQHRHVFDFETHNERQTSFPFGAELVFAWPVLFTKNESFGRMAFWLALPATAVGIIFVCRAIDASRTAGRTAALLYLSTPTVLYYSVGLKSDLWVPPFVLGSIYFALPVSSPGKDRTGLRLALSGAFLALAANVKATALALTPGLIIAVVLGGNYRRFLHGLGDLTKGFAATAVVCGLAVLLASNAVIHGHPFGSPGLRSVVQPEFSLRQLYTHAIRVPLFLFELPVIPSEPIRRAIETRGKALTHWTGADYKLPLEHKAIWPGSFSFNVPRTAANYSLGGLLWLPCLAAGLWVALCDLRRSWPDPIVRRYGALALVQLPLFLGVVFLIRWMGGGPGRFWLPAFALSVPLPCVLVERWAGRSRIVRTTSLLALLAILMVSYASIRGETISAYRTIQQPPPPGILNAPYQEVLPLLASGSRILLIASQHTRDYPLFAPHAGFVNHVHPWGRSPFDAARTEAIIDRERITHVLIEDDRLAKFHWHGAIGTRPFVSWIGSHPAFQEMPLSTERMRLFLRRPQ